MSGASSLHAAIELALNAYLQKDPDSPQRLARLYGKAIALEIEGLGAIGNDLRLFFLPHGSGVQVSNEFTGTPDAVIRGTPLALARLGLSDNKARDLGKSGVTLEGDTAVSQAFTQLLSDVDIDWEEELAQWLGDNAAGDAAAHQLGDLARAFGAWGQRARHSLAADLTEYLQEESGLLPTPAEIEQLLDEIDRFRSDVDRLEARIRRLEQALIPPEDDPEDEATP